MRGGETVAWWKATSPPNELSSLDWGWTRPEAKEHDAPRLSFVTCSPSRHCCSLRSSLSLQTSIVALASESRCLGSSVCFVLVFSPQLSPLLSHRVRSEALGRNYSLISSPPTVKLSQASQASSFSTFSSGFEVAPARTVAPPPKPFSVGCTAAEAPSCTHPNGPNPAPADLHLPTAGSLPSSQPVTQPSRPLPPPSHLSPRTSSELASPLFDSSSIGFS